MSGPARDQASFTLVEVVLALGIVAFVVLATVGLLSVANETNKRARDEAFTAQLAANEFERLHSLSTATFPTGDYSRYYDASMAEVPEASAVYELQIAFSAAGATAAADRIVNAEVRYPANAPNPTKVLFTQLMNLPKP